MSPHHRWLILDAAAVKSRRIASARAAAAGSAMVVFFQRRGAPRQAGLAHQPGDPLAGMPPALAALGADRGPQANRGRTR